MTGCENMNHSWVLILISLSSISWTPPDLRGGLSGVSGSPGDRDWQAGDQSQLLQSSPHDDHLFWCVLKTSIDRQMDRDVENRLFRSQHASLGQFRTCVLGYFSSVDGKLQLGLLMKQEKRMDRWMDGWRPQKHTSNRRPALIDKYECSKEKWRNGQLSVWWKTSNAPRCVQTHG